MPAHIVSTICKAAPDAGGSRPPGGENILPTDDYADKAFSSTMSWKRCFLRVVFRDVGTHAGRFGAANLGPSQWGGSAADRGGVRK